jgi:flagellar FliL protein
VADETSAPEAVAERPKQSNFMLILIIVIVSLVSSAGGAFLTSYMIGKTLAAQPEAGKDAEEKKEPTKEEAVAEAIEHGAIVPLDPFVVNLADKDAPRYLRIKVTLMVDNKEKVAEIAENAALREKVRDIILQTLSKKTSQELIDEAGKNKLREEIHQGIGLFFKEPKLTDVMFTEFVIQL